MFLKANTWYDSIFASLFDHSIWRSSFKTMKISSNDGHKWYLGKFAITVMCLFRRGSQSGISESKSEYVYVIFIDNTSKVILLKTPLKSSDHVHSHRHHTRSPVPTQIYHVLHWTAGDLFLLPLWWVRTNISLQFKFSFLFHKQVWTSFHVISGYLHFFFWKLFCLLSLFL